MARTGGSALIGGVFSDPFRAKNAFETLMGDGPNAPSDVDVIFSSFNGEYLIIVTAKSARAERKTERVFREFGARAPVDLLTSERASSEGDPSRSGGREADASAEEHTLLDRWTTLTTSFIVNGIADPGDLLVRMLKSQESARILSEGGPAPGLRDADGELREVTARLAALLRASHPELFDRAGRLRSSDLTRRLIAASGGKRTLSGDDLLALETAADDDVAELTGRAT